VRAVRRNRRLDSIREPLQGKALSDVTNRLKTARGHIDHIVEMLEAKAYTIDVLRQAAAVRGALDATVRTALRYYFEHAFVNAVKTGQTEAAVDELMAALAFLREIE
jgi:CsoR family transcriptional regulator, copper-sensing transcriptional repressor